MTFINLDDHEQRELVPGCRVRFVHSDNMTVAYWEFDPGTDLPLHTHVHEQVTSLIEGSFVLTVDGESRELSPGMVAVIPPEIPHSGKAITKSRIIDVFHPVREDYR